MAGYGVYTAYTETEPADSPTSGSHVTLLCGPEYGIKKLAKITDGRCPFSHQHRTRNSEVNIHKPQLDLSTRLARPDTSEQKHTKYRASRRLGPFTPAILGGKQLRKTIFSNELV